MRKISYENKIKYKSAKVLCTNTPYSTQLPEKIQPTHGIFPTSSRPRSQLPNLFQPPFHEVLQNAEAQQIQPYAQLFVELLKVVLIFYLVKVLLQQIFKSGKSLTMLRRISINGVKYRKDLYQKKVHIYIDILKYYRSDYIRLYSAG